MTIIRIGVDTSKHLFQVHGVDEAEQPVLALEMLGVLFAQVAAIEARLKTLEAELIAWHRSDPVSQCLATQPGIGPIASGQADRT